ncbi:MAG: hypothetical protein GY725_10130 [bacterium]|nr:hypothetical protein [bacterium]
MLLRASSEIAGSKVDLRAVTEGTAVESGVPGERVLIDFIDAAMGTGDADLADARAAVRRELGVEALVDAAAVLGNFERMVRIADGTGIPLDDKVAMMSVDMREELGIDDFGSASETPPVTGLKRLVARALQPVLVPVMRFMVRKMSKP